MINEVMKKRGSKPPRQGPLWEGPSGGGPNGGVSFSLLSRFLVCRERFRIHAVEGLRTRDTFNHRLEFGNIWHVMEESFAREKGKWRTAANEYLDDLCGRYPQDRPEIGLWYDKATALFPHYAEHWQKHPDVINRTPVLQEQVFDVTHRLPSGREVRLRGKWDSVDLVRDAGVHGIWLQENKTKSSIDTVKITRQLKFDLQTMLYLTALHHDFPAVMDAADNQKLWADVQIRGVRYNAVRRAAHRSAVSMMEKYGKDKEDDRLSEWFARWNVEVTPKDVSNFREWSLDPILETLCCWWAVKTGGETCGDCAGHLHWRHPFGVWNALDEGGSTDIDNYLETGSTLGLRVVDSLFPELA